MAKPLIERREVEVGIARWDGYGIKKYEVLINANLKNVV